MAQLSDQDLILLNSYLDGRLTTSERAALEARLSADVSLRAELESLRDTVGLLRMAERVPVPRSFTLDPAAFAKQPGPSLWERLGLASLPGWAYAGASLVVVLLVGALVLGSLPGGTPSAAPMVAMEAPAPTEAPTEESAAEMAAPAAEAPAEATEETMFSFLAESETPGADSAMPPMPTGAAPKMGDGTPPEGVGGMGGGMGGEPGVPSGGVGGGPAEEPSPMPQPTEAPMVAQSGTGEPEDASSAARAAADMGDRKTHV